MSFGADLKEFTKSFQAGYKMVDDAQLNQKRRELMDADIAEKRGPIDAFNRGRSGTVQSVTSQGTDGSTLTGDLAKAADAIATVESSGQPNNGYGALGKIIKRKDGTEDQALGRFQIMRSNLPSWTKEALGRALTPEEFIKSPQAQDAVFKHRFGGYLAKTGNLGDAASLWHSGKLLADAQDRVDPLGTRTPDYVTRVLKAYGVSPTKPQPPATPAVVGGVPLPPARPNAQPAQAVPLSSGDGYEGEPYDDGSLGFAEGGVIPYGSEDNPEPARALDLSKQPAAASAQPALQAQDAQPAPMNPFRSLGDALHGGLSFLENHFGLSEQNAALPGTDAKRGEAQQRFMMGEGAASPQEYADVMRTVDPQGQLNDSVRNIAGINAVWEYYLMRGDVQKANASAASLMQYTRNVAAKYGATAIQQLKQGDVQGAAASVQKGYDYTPDGAHLEAKVDPSGNGMARQVDSQSGKVLGQIQVTPQVLMQAAMGLSSGGEYWNQVMEAALRADPLARRNTGDPNLSADIASSVPELKVPDNLAAILGSPTGGPPTGDDANAETPDEYAPSAPEPEGAGEGAGFSSTGAGGEGGEAPIAPSAPEQAVPMRQKPSPKEPATPAAFETLFPRPVMGNPPAGLRKPSEVAQWRQVWEAKQLKPWLELKKQYDAKVGAEYKFQRGQFFQQQRFSQQQDREDRRHEYDANVRNEREALTQDREDRRFAAGQEAKEVDLQRIKPIEPEALKNATMAIGDLKEKSNDPTSENPLRSGLAEFPDPQNPSQPMGDADKVSEFLGKKNTRAVRDLAIGLHARGLPADTAMSLVGTMVSSKMITESHGGTQMMPKYEFLGLDKAGNAMLRADGRVVHLNKDDFQAMEDARLDIAKRFYSKWSETRGETPGESAVRGVKEIGAGTKGALKNLRIDPSNMYGGPIQRPASPASQPLPSDNGPSPEEQDFENQDWVQQYRRNSALPLR